MIVAVLIVVALGVLLAVVLTRDSEESASNEALETSESQDAANETSAPADGVEPAANVEEIELMSVGDYEGDGTATRSFENGQFLHEVIANIDDPAEGKFYEGWLVGGGQILSTGELEKEDEGVYSLVFESDQDLTDRDQVVITEETLANGLDGNPEDHVLEGSF